MKSVIKYIFEIIHSLAKAAMIAVLMFASAWLGWHLRAARPAHLVPVERQGGELPTIEEIQRRIGALPDGKLGPETQAKWDRALCDQYAAETLRKAMPYRAQRDNKLRNEK